MPKPGHSAKGSNAKAGTLMPGSKVAASTSGGGPPKPDTSRHGSGFIKSAKKGD